MPIYEYECLKCGLRFESLQKINDSPPKCSKCKSKTKRLISISSFCFGGGPPSYVDLGSDDGIVTRQPIIKDRKTGNVLYGPNLPTGD